MIRTAFLLLSVVAMLLVWSVGEAAQPRIGIKVGMAQTALPETDEGNILYYPQAGEFIGFPGEQSRSGMAGGLSVELPLNSTWVFRPELLYVQKGKKGGSPKLELALDYVEIPLLMKASIPLGGGLSGSLFGGPGLALCVKHELTSAEERPLNPPTLTVENVQSTEFIGCLGAGLAVSLGQGRLELEARFTGSFSDIAGNADPVYAPVGPDDRIEIPPAYSGKNGAFLVMVGYSIGL